MQRAISPTCALVAWAMISLSGCTTLRFRPPPEVIAQPEATTATEAVAEGKAAETRDAAEADIREAAAETGVAANAATTVETPVTPAPPTTEFAPAAFTQRYRPTERSVEDIRKQNAAVPPPLDFQERIDQMHDRIYTWLQGRVEATDRKFADKDKELKPTPAAPFRLGMVLESVDRSDGMDINFDADLDIALSLPNIEERLRIFVTSDELDEAPRIAGEDRNLRVGLRYRTFRTFDFDIGVKLNVPPAAFVSLRWQREFQLGSWQFYPFAKLFADTTESVGYAVAATFDHWSGRSLLRSSTYGKWRDDRDRIDWTQSLIYAHASQVLAPDRYGSYLKANDIGRGWGMRLLANGERASTVTYYEANFFFRRPTASPWFFWYVEPLVRWDREYNWHADPGIRVGINMLFWDLARPAR